MDLKNSSGLLQSKDEHESPELKNIFRVPNETFLQVVNLPVSLPVPAEARWSFKKCDLVLHLSYTYKLFKHPSKAGWTWSRRTTRQRHSIIIPAKTLTTPHRCGIRKAMTDNSSSTEGCWRLEFGDTDQGKCVTSIIRIKTETRVSGKRSKQATGAGGGTAGAVGSRGSSGASLEWSSWGSWSPRTWEWFQERRLGSPDRRVVKEV